METQAQNKVLYYKKHILYIYVVVVLFYYLDTPVSWKIEIL